MRSALVSGRLLELAVGWRLGSPINLPTARPELDWQKAGEGARNYHPTFTYPRQPGNGQPMESPDCTKRKLQNPDADSQSCLAINAGNAWPRRHPGGAAAKRSEAAEGGPGGSPPVAHTEAEKIWEGVFWSKFLRELWFPCGSERCKGRGK